MEADVVKRKTDDAAGAISKNLADGAKELRRPAKKSPTRNPLSNLGDWAHPAKKKSKKKAGF
jgi:hypothetical protein